LNLGDGFQTALSFPMNSLYAFCQLAPELARAPAPSAYSEYSAVPGASRLSPFPLFAPVETQTPFCSAVQPLASVPLLPSVKLEDCSLPNSPRHRPLLNRSTPTHSYFLPPIFYHKNSAQLIRGPHLFAPIFLFKSLPSAVSRLPSFPLFPSVKSAVWSSHPCLSVLIRGYKKSAKFAQN
jgi:hypothetical protein